MDHRRLATLTHFLRHRPSRRDILRGLIGTGIGLGSLRLDGAGARNKHHKKHKNHQAQSPPPPNSPPPQSPPSPPPPACTPHCGHKRCGDDGCGGSCGSCPIGQFCRSGTCCTPEPREVTCAGRCDTVTSIRTCGQPVACSCPSGQVCLSNGTCAIVCTGINSCPSRCICGGPNTEGAKVCLVTFDCSTPCTSTAECPLGTHCQLGVAPCQEGGCMPLCNDATE
jgi:hypothetical protein